MTANSTVVVKTIIKFKRGTDSDWRRLNPILNVGEPGFETNTFQLKIGDGYTNWNSLPYISGDGTQVSADGKSISIKYIDGIKTFYLNGFDNADVGQIPRKGSSGNFEWVDLAATITEVVTNTTYTKNQINTKLELKQDKLTAGNNINIATNNTISAKGLDLSVTEENLVFCENQ